VDRPEDLEPAEGPGRVPAGAEHGAEPHDLHVKALELGAGLLRRGELREDAAAEQHHLPIARGLAEGPQEVRARDLVRAAADAHGEGPLEELIEEQIAGEIGPIPARLGEGRAGHRPVKRLDRSAHREGEHQGLAEIREINAHHGLFREQIRDREGGARRRDHGGVRVHEDRLTLRARRCSGRAGSRALSLILAHPTRADYRFSSSIPR
jgi:hypothetical protein